jgi:hypothetical protein
VYFVTFDINCREGTCGTKILAGTATDAGSFIDSRNIGTQLVVRIERHHLNGSYGTVTSAVVALHAIVRRQTVLFNPNGVTYLDRGLLFHRDGADSPCRTDLRTEVTFRTTVAALIAHLRLHQGHQTRGRTKHLIGALGYTKLAARAMLGEVLCREGTRRNKGCLALRRLLVLDFSESSIHFQLRFLSESCGGYCCRSKKEGATGKSRLSPRPPC